MSCEQARPRIGVIRFGSVRLCPVRPPLFAEARLVRQREAEQVFNLPERQDNRLRVSLLQVLEERQKCARHGAPLRLRRFHVCLVIMGARRHAPLQPVQHRSFQTLLFMREKNVASTARLLS